MKNILAPASVAATALILLLIMRKRRRGWIRLEAQ